MAEHNTGPATPPSALIEDLAQRGMLKDVEKARTRLRLGYPVWLVLDVDRVVEVLSEATSIPSLKEPLGVEAIDIDADATLDPALLKASRVVPLADGRVAIADPYRELPEKLRDREPCLAHGREIDQVLGAIFPGQDKGRNTRRIGRLLIDEGVVSEREIAEALEEQKKSGQKLGEILAARGVLGHLEEERSTFPRLRLGTQITIAALAPLLLPFLLYVALYELGIDAGPYAYIFVVVTLSISAYLFLLEGLEAFKPSEPPDEPRVPYPPASALIVAYLPNEADTIIENVQSFLRVEYPAPLRIILVYNTPEDLPVEKELQGIADREGAARFLPLRDDTSSSKAQNINVALTEVQGEFVGIFDADHQPERDSFTRAWRWLAEPGNNVVQGHNVIRNGESSWFTRVVAVEFEAIYALSHPGRTRLHGFGIFGGSNGYWETDLLRETKMRGFMLTEDIDATVRTIDAGYNIVTDPRLISRELSPESFQGWWNQRMRWAQGWFQISLHHLLRGLRSKHLTLRQKLSFLYLFGWREVFPWLSLQVFPILAFILWRGDAIDWLVPIFVLTTIFTLGMGPWQTLLSYLLAVPEVKKHKAWFLLYLIATTPFYAELKNLIQRVAQIKEIMGEHQWKITPRS